ncbi:MAG TPA: pirin family protein [Patescibacteria group bacterium]|nr:pirin family protein [Patescibacteria group bacterium]
MKTTVYTSESRGKADHGWLKSRHTFSFAGYQDRSRMNFGLLRVLNDDIVAPGKGFGAHPHENMEIVSIPLKGTLAHKDSTGTAKEIKTGDVQIMSAGSGITHSEFNYSAEEEVHFLQIWIYPKERDIQPRYEQKSFVKEEYNGAFKEVVSPEKGSDGVWINQDAWFSLGHFKAGDHTQYSLKKSGNGAFVMVLEGEVEIDGTILKRRDAISIEDFENVELRFLKDSQMLVIDVPMSF